MLRRAAKLAHLVRTPEYVRAAFNGVFAAIEHEAALNEILLLRTVIDIGAHRGQFSLVARRRFPHAAILAFEPQARARRKYRSVFGNSAQLFPYAIGRCSGSAVLNVPAYSGSASLLPISAAQFEMFPETGEISYEPVEVRRLDELVHLDRIARPSLLKIDVQGYELEILRAIDLSNIDNLIVEASCVECYEGQPLIGEVRQFLHDSGFVISAECNPLFGADGTLAQVDIVAINASGNRRTKSSPARRNQSL